MAIEEKNQKNVGCDGSVKMPFSVVISPMRYSVERSTDVSNNEGCYGRITHGDKKIQVSTGLCLQMEQSVLLHEIVHGMLDELGYGSMSSDEILVKGLTTKLLLLLNDNPELISYLTSSHAT